ncbi:hypothetical protein D3C81_1347690 [compost metagenome]
MKNVQQHGYITVACNYFGVIPDHPIIQVRKNSSYTCTASGRKNHFYLSIFKHHHQIRGSLLVGSGKKPILGIYVLP